MPIRRLSPQPAVQRLRRRLRLLAGGLMVVAGLILIADPDFG
jgi:uncharacterized membrane protein HdeD (DUF308 family)